MKGQIKGVAKPSLTAGILIDNSASMSKRGTERTFFENALKKSESIIKGLRDNDRVVLNVTCPISTGHIGASFFPSDPLTPAQATSLLSKIKNLPIKAGVEQAVQALMQKMALSERPGRELFFLTDLHENGYGKSIKEAANNKSSDTTALNSIQKQLNEFLILDMSEAPTGPLLYVNSIEISTRMISTGMPVTIEAVIQNTGALPSKPTGIELIAGKEKFRAIVPGVLPNSESKCTFNLTFNKSGEIPCQIIIPNSDNSYESNFFFSLKIRKRIYALLVNSSKSRLKTERDTFYTKLALSPVARVKVQETGNIITVDSDLSDFSRYELDKFDLVILNDPAGIDDLSVDALESYLMSGGGIIITSGPNMEEYAKKDNQANHSGISRILPGNLNGIISASGQSGLNMDVFNNSHELISFFRKNNFSLLRAAEFKKAIVLSVNNLNPDIRVIAGFDQQTPALVLKKNGIGRILFFTSSFDMAWGNLPLTTAFVPFVHQLARYLCTNSSSSLWNLCGSVQDVTLPLGSVKAVLNVATPLGSKKVIPFKAGSTFLMARLSATDEHGIYTLVKDDGKKVIESLFAVNPDPKEWSFKKIVFPDLSNSSSNRPDQLSTPEYRYELWNYFLFFIIILSILELLAGSRKEKKETLKKGTSLILITLLISFFLNCNIMQNFAYAGTQSDVTATVQPLNRPASTNENMGVEAKIISGKNTLENYQIVFEKMDVFPFVAIITAALISFFLYRRTAAHIDKKRFLILITLRMLLLLLILLMLLKPVALLDYKIEIPGIIGVILDTSDSMSIGDTDLTETSSNKLSLKGSRLETAMKSLNGKFMDLLESRGQAVFFSAGSKIDRLSKDDLKLLRPDNGYTDLGEAILRASRNIDKTQLSSLIVVSDGNSNFGPDPVLMARLAGVPVHTLGVGSSKRTSDLGIQSITAPNQAFVGVPVKIRVKILSSGFSPMKVPLYLYEGSKELSRKFIEIRGSVQTAEFIYTPDSDGIKKMNVSIQNQETELLRNNNTREFIMRAVEARTRVLVFASKPSFDYKFIRSALIRDDSVILTAGVYRQDSPELYYSGSKSDEINKIQGLSWPLKNSSDLDIFDVIFLIDPHHSAIPAEYIKAFLEKGKGVFTIGDHTQLFENSETFKAILPFSWKKNDSSSWQNLDFRIKLSDQGMVHEAVKLVPGTRANSFIWSDWPELKGFSRFNIKAGARVLLQGVPRGEKEFPLLAVQRYSKGRIASFVSPGLWKLSFETGISQVQMPEYDEDSFIRFISNMTRWCHASEQRNSLMVRTDRFHYLSGEKVMVNARLYDHDSNLVEKGFVRISLYRDKMGLAVDEIMNNQVSLDGFVNNKSLQLVDSNLLLTPEKRDFKGILIPDMTGTFIVEAQYSMNADFSDISHIGRSLFLVRTPAMEFTEFTRNIKALKEIAKASGGEYRDVQACLDIPSLISDVGITRKKIKNMPLWDSWWAYSLFLILLCLEWVIRKREGLR